MTGEPIAIGTRLWRFDVNRRVYRDRNSPPIYEEHFAPGIVTGETRGMWIVDGRSRVNKKTLRSPSSGGFSGDQWFTDAGKEEAIWAKTHRLKLVERIRSCDVATLKKIAALLEEPTA